VDQEIYVFKVKLGYDKRVWREIGIRGSQTLHDLNLAIVDAFDFYDWHLYSFFMSGRAWDSSTEFVSPDYFLDLGSWEPVGDEKRRADEVLISSLELEPKQKFLYLFDYGDDWRFEVQFLEQVASEEEGVDYPRITKRCGESPPQYPEDEEEPSNSC